MRVGWRFGIAALAAASIFGSVPALAQNNADPATNTAAPPPAETVGPRELRDFTINGTVTRPAPTPPERVPAPAPATTTSRPAPRASTPADTPPPIRERPAPSPIRDLAPEAGSVTTTLPPAEPATQPTTGADPSAGVQPGFSTAAPAPLSLPDEQPGSILPWILALLLLGAGAAYFLSRQRSSPGYATASATPRAYAEPEPSPRPEPQQRVTAPRADPAPQPRAGAAPRPQPARPAPPAGVVTSKLGARTGVVTTSLRPWLDIEFTPGRCVVEDDKATIQFDVAITNSGSAPARDVLVEASMFNAGPAQDQEIGAFFAHPAATGDRIPAIPPLKRIALKTSVSLTREQMRQYEIGGRKLFVPLVGLNALYRWSGGDGQTSASYVVGRDTDGEKMAPLRLDLGPRIFRGLGARRHNVALRN
jgi:hypothetical protein